MAKKKSYNYPNQTQLYPCGIMGSGSPTLNTINRSVDLFHINLIFALIILFIAGNTTYAQNEKSNSENTNTLLDNSISQYHNNVIGISQNGLIKGRDAMKAYLLQLSSSQGSLVSYKTHYKIPVSQALEYEIGSSQTETGAKNAHLIIWTKENESVKKIAEIIYDLTGNLEIPSELAKSRTKWVKLCNEHNAKKLVEELYTVDAIYYNRGRVLRGREQLSNEYGYMDNPAYKLQLNPKHIEMVSDDIIYEIGLCGGSYNLPYILVWKKQQEGNWKIYIDSNY